MADVSALPIEASVMATSGAAKSKNKIEEIKLTTPVAIMATVKLLLWIAKYAPTILAIPKTEAKTINIFLIFGFYFFQVSRTHFFQPVHFSSFR